MKTAIRTIQGLTLAIGASLAIGAQASYIGIDTTGLSTATTDSSNDYTAEPGAEIAIGDTAYEGATVEAFESGPFRLTFTYLFKEAGFTNSFWYAGSELFNTASSSYGDSVSTLFSGAAGPLDFFFRSQGHVSTIDIHNEDNDASEVPNFQTFWEAGSNSLIVALDDFGAGPDDNHDDMIIRITASKVPEPGTMALLGLGLAAMGVSLRRRQSAS
ncbi:MAG: PEP-CTERM sorting domain-containing protein [Oleiphilaceae bacterium]|nr:PEP-CTERM sorting domain-containing protein [Oleiphilaceae bacterium]